VVERVAARGFGETGEVVPVGTVGAGDPRRGLVLAAGVAVEAGEGIHELGVARPLHEVLVERNGPRGLAAERDDLGHVLLDEPPASELRVRVSVVGEGVVEPACSGSPVDAWYDARRASAVGDRRRRSDSSNLRRASSG